MRQNEVMLPERNLYENTHLISLLLCDIDTQMHISTSLNMLHVAIDKL